MSIMLYDDARDTLAMLKDVSTSSDVTSFVSCSCFDSKSEPGPRCC